MRDTGSKEGISNRSQLEKKRIRTEAYSKDGQCYPTPVVNGLLAKEILGWSGQIDLFACKGIARVHYFAFIELL